jgi:hypothetical protein
MPLPSPLQTVTVRGDWISPVTGDPLTGEAKLAAVRPVQVPAADLELTTTPHLATITGGVAQWTDVVLSDSAGLSEPILYRLTVNGNGFREDRLLQLLTTQAVAGVIQLADIPTAVEGIPVVTYVLAASVGLPGGPAGPLDSSGKVPLVQLPPGGGGGVASVTAADATIVVAGTGTDPTVRVGTIAEAQVAGLVADLAGKAAVVHTHTSGQITDFVTAVDGRIALVVDAAPASLDTLRELADALGDDPNFAATMAAALASKALAARQITAGTGLTGGGDLTADRTLAVQFGAAAGTAAEGNDSRITGAVQASIVDAKGDLLAGTGDNTIARLPVGTDGQAVVADSSQASGLRYVDRQIGDFPFAGDGLIAASAPLTNFRDNSSLGAAGWAVRLPIPAGKPITTCWGSVVGVGTVGAGGVNGFAVYDDAGNLLSSTVDDNNLWTVGGVRSKPLPAAIAAQSSDRYVYLAMRITGYSAPPTHPFCQGQAGGQLLDGLFGAGRRRGVVLSGSSWAGTIDTATGTSPSGYTPFLALS